MTVAPPPPFLRWVIPATIFGTLLVFGFLLRMQHNHVPFDKTASVSVHVETADPRDLMEWLDQAAPLVASLRGAFNDLSDAARSSDFAGMSVACHAGLDFTGALVIVLPSPEVRLNDPLRQALDGYDQALRHCVTGSENSDPAELAIAGDMFAVGDRQWNAAIWMFDTPWPGLPSGNMRPSHVFKT